jgi:hypothetical protein
MSLLLALASAIGQFLLTVLQLLLAGIGVAVVVAGASYLTYLVLSAWLFPTAMSAPNFDNVVYATNSSDEARYRYKQLLRNAQWEVTRIGSCHRARAVIGTTAVVLVSYGPLWYIVQG